ncbi:MAG: hypothetical protein CMN30_33040 [Sandaracinus sp.]|nr:hypothetical protein [Sandaracinus sp.]MAQ19616.1 hypothetical protein [Sandaracinus sp.]|tara:strand:- start:4894 stop:5223 length:330 start_codon:yes stop_codon:yes gene_type:complete
MKDVTPRERWDLWMHQAQRFADRENYIDALGRTRLVLQEIQATLEAGDPHSREHQRLEKFASRVEGRMKGYRKSFEIWNAKIAARRAAATANAEQEMAQPLPIGPDEIY